MNEFDRAAQGSTGGLAREMLYFLRESKKWWLLPIIVLFFATERLLVEGLTSGAEKG